MSDCIMVKVETHRELARQSLCLYNIVDDKGDDEHRNTEKTEDFREQMLLHNKICGIIPFKVINENTQKKYEYNIAGLISLAELFIKEKPGYGLLSAVLKGILDIIAGGKEYMLSEDDYVIRTDTVFVDKENRVLTVYFPGYSQPLREQLRDLGDSLMDMADYSDEASVMLVYGFYMRTKDNTCSLEDLQKSVLPAEGSSGTGSDPSVWKAEEILASDREKQADILRSGAESMKRADIVPPGPDRGKQADIFRSGAGRIKRPDIVPTGSDRRKRVDLPPGSDRKKQTEILPNPEASEGVCSARDKAGLSERLKNGEASFGSTQLPTNKRNVIIQSENMQNRDPSDMFRDIGREEIQEKKPEIGVILAQSPLKLKVIGFILPMAAIMIVFAVIRSGILINGDTGKPDSVRMMLLIAAVLGACYEAEKLIWGRFAARFREKLASAALLSGEETVILYGEETAGYPFSLVSDSEPAINVSHFPFFVGKDAIHCDYVMASQVGISRYHMKIDKDGEDYTISDLNSTNGTYINGERLPPHLPRKVRRGDELRIGRCIYYCN